MLRSAHCQLQKISQLVGWLLRLLRLSIIGFKFPQVCCQVKFITCCWFSLVPLLSSCSTIWSSQLQLGVWFVISFIFVRSSLTSVCFSALKKFYFYFYFYFFFPPAMYVFPSSLPCLLLSTSCLVIAFLYFPSTISVNLRSFLLLFISFV